MAPVAVADSMDPVRILVIGPVQGRLERFVERINEINARSGPFGFCACVGDFFAPETTAADVAALKKLEIDVYAMMGNSALSTEMAELVEQTQGKLAPRATFLGSCGQLTTAEGIRLAFLGGSFDAAAYISDATETPLLTAAHYRKTAVKALSAAMSRTSAEDAERYGVDLLLTSEWPWGFHVGSARYRAAVDAHKLPSSLKPGMAGVNRAIANMARALQPRYHFASALETFFEREPYANAATEIDGDTARTARHCTRFLGLAPFEKAGDRWHYAMNLVPLRKAPLDALDARPADVTPLPYMDKPEAGTKRAAGDAQNDASAKRSRKTRVLPADYVCHRCHVPGHWFRECPQGPTEKSDRAPPPSTYTCHACEQSGHWIEDCPVRQEQEARRAAAPAKIAERDATCWFCPPDFANPDAAGRFASHLLLYCTDHAYVSLAKGPLVDKHLLLVPMQHYPSLAYLEAHKDEEGPRQVLEDMARMRERLAKWLATQQLAPLVYEVYGGARMRGLQHVCQHIVPVPEDHVDGLETLFSARAAEHGWSRVDRLPASATETGYFSVILPGGAEMHFVPLEAPAGGPRHQTNKPQARRGPSLQVARFLLCDHLQLPDRKNWHSCCGSREDEEALAASVKDSVQSLFA